MLSDTSSLSLFGIILVSMGFIQVGDEVIRASNGTIRAGPDL